jgi:kynurenine formamidase
VGPACVVDVRGFAGRAVPAAFLEPHLEALRAADFLLLRSGWDARWGAPDYFSGFPHLAVEAARLAVSCGLKGVGVDAISIDAHDSTAFEVHHVLLGAGVVVLENLARLDQLPATGATLVAAPLKFRGSDGAPIRALALVG